MDLLLNSYINSKPVLEQNSDQEAASSDITASEIESNHPETSCPPNESTLESHYKELEWRDGAEILAEAANIIPGLGKGIQVVLGLGEHSPEQRLKNKQFKWILEQISIISNQLDKLLNELPHEEQPEPADVAAIFEAALKASRKTAGYQKRQLLKNALVNAFSLEQYQAGLTLRLFSILENLEYGDVELLQKMIRVGTQGQPITWSNFDWNKDPLSLQYHHLELLKKEGLVTVRGTTEDEPVGYSFCRAREMRGRDSQLSSLAKGRVFINELGEKFIQFVKKEKVS